MKAVERVLSFTPSGPRGLGRTLLAILVLGLLAVPGASAKPVALKGKPRTAARHAPSCTYFSGTVARWALGPVSRPSVTTITRNHTICTWTGQASGQYSYVVTVSVFPAPSFLGRSLLSIARRSAEKANRSPDGVGIYLRGPNPRRSLYFEGLAAWGEEQPDTSRSKCPMAGIEGAEYENKAIEKGQSSPACPGQPGNEGDFAEAYGSPRGGVEPMVLQINVACQQSKLSELTPGRAVRAFFATY